MFRADELSQKFYHVQREGNKSISEEDMFNILVMDIKYTIRITNISSQDENGPCRRTVHSGAMEKRAGTPSNSQPSPQMAAKFGCWYIINGRMVRLTSANRSSKIYLYGPQRDSPD